MRKLLAGVCFALLALSAGEARAQFGLGGQLSWADDAELGVGVRGVFNLPAAVPLEVIGSFDYFFPDEGDGVDVTYWELNTNVVYLFPVAAPLIAPYAGGGLNFAHASRDPGFPGADGSNTELGLNLVGGAKFNVGSVTPFAELRLEVDGGEQFVLTGGVLFRVGPGL